MAKLWFACTFEEILAQPHIFSPLALMPPISLHPHAPLLAATLNRSVVPPRISAPHRCPPHSVFGSCLTPCASASASHLRPMSCRRYTAAFLNPYIDASVSRAAPYHRASPVLTNCP
ncbi:hypothetical protein Salat_1458600 [Sesamum alatum]|uniref:Uncharacterized protein n=1 Tax=Sesamum alatum TaxID=300844 RepID=A0AAE1YC69_9LAMI|nr:hypothetical protein Salat_1458600 [Sesamum alatum]